MHGLEDSDSSIELTGTFCLNSEPVTASGVGGGPTADATAVGDGSPTSLSVPADGHETREEDGKDGRGGGNDKDDDR